MSDFTSHGSTIATHHNYWQVFVQLTSHNTDTCILRNTDIWTGLVPWHLTLFLQGNLAFLCKCPSSAATIPHSFWYQKILLVLLLLMKIKQFNLPSLQHYNVLSFPYSFLPTHLQSFFFTNSSCFTNKCNLLNSFYLGKFSLKRKY